jgi:hypothetical protein
MSRKSASTGNVSSPASTGGAGTFFEQHVGAHWLSLLLVRAIPPIIHDCTVVEVHFQTERLGWSTDDFVIVGEAGSGIRRKLIGQVKRSFTVSAANVECKQAIQDFWLDFGKTEQFRSESDRFAIVTLRGTNTLLESFSALLDCARAARDAVEFEHRLTTPGLLNAKAIRYCDEIQTIIGELEGTRLSVAAVWAFLRVLHVLSLDLNSSTRQTEAWIKSLLAHTAIEQDGIGAANATWHALLSEMGEGMPEAQSFARRDLPGAIRDRHSCIAGPEKRILESLADHSTLILRGIRSALGKDLHLRRAGLVQSVINQLELAQVVLLSGPAGSGKSGVAADSLEILAADHFVFSFRAEEFALASLDETLHCSQVPASARTVGAVLAGQARKILLVESVERLLEASTRDAFTDLLTLVAEDESWRLLLTCRDYSTDLVRDAFLELSGVVHSVVIVPPLDDTELKEVELAYPAIARPLTNAPLRGLLRNPYILDKALLISWPEDKPLPESEREFRALFWRDVIRVDNRAADGMPSRRERTFVEIALRRARALGLFASCADLDPAVTNALRFDSLLARSNDRDQFFATAHDVLEDWAILHWLNDQYATNDGSATQLSTAIGTHPAVRRTYRKWVGELIDRELEGAEVLFLAVLAGPSLPNHFCDDTLVAFLRSPISASFLEKHRTLFFSERKRLLRRIIHLIRVACVTAPSWLGKHASGASPFIVPTGPAWAAVLRLVSTQLAAFEKDDHLLLLGLIEDWSRGISWELPYPDGADSVSAIAHYLLPYFDDYRSNEERKRALTVLASVPAIDKDRFAAILLGSSNGKRLDRMAEDFREIVLEGIAGAAACRDLPELVVSATKEHLLLERAEFKKKGAFGGSISIEPLFGIREERHHGFSPASALRGPFLRLLQHHPDKGLDLLISVFNHSSEWYARRRVYSEHLERPVEITLTLSDGFERKQWCNARLWDLYRGTSGGPCVLQSGLMALEHWLLDMADLSPSRLDVMLVDIIRRSESVALTAVVASVASAHPRRSGEALLVLLSSKECIVLDRGRLAGEFHALRLSLSGPYGDAMDKYCAGERKFADARPHRRVDLVAAILNIQVGPLAGRAHASIDRHRAELPPIGQQREFDRIWRIALHGMDLRQYTVATDMSGAPTPALSVPPRDKDQNRVVLNPKAPDPDIQEMVAQSTRNLQAMNARAGLKVWGLKVFNRENDATYDSNQWRARLDEARAANRTQATESEYDPGKAGPAVVAAVCARDYWEELSDEEREWCVDIICKEVVRNGDNWDRTARVRSGIMSAECQCAQILPALLCATLADETRMLVIRTLVIALTHPVNEVRWNAARGTGERLWTLDPALTLRCVNMLATEAMIIQNALISEKHMPHHERRAFAEIEQQACERVRLQFFESEGVSADALLRFDPSHSVGAVANIAVLSVLSQGPIESPAIDAFRCLVQVLVGWWDGDGDQRRYQRDRNHETESALTNLLERFLFRVETDQACDILRPALNAVDRHSREISWLLLGMIGIEDETPSTEKFWRLWRLFAESVRRASWLAQIDEPHSDGRELLAAVFLGTSWKENIRNWRSLEGYEHHLHSLFEDLPASSTVMEAYLRFLYHIGEKSLPKAFVRIANRLVGNRATGLLGGRDSVFMLETLLRRYVYGRPLELKRNSQLRNAILQLLDALIDIGSSAAFRMRDDFVTPITPS